MTRTTKYYELRLSLVKRERERQGGGVNRRHGDGDTDKWSPAGSSGTNDVDEKQETLISCRALLGIAIMYENTINLLK